MEEIIKSIYMELLTLFPVKKKKQNIVYCMSFIKNDGGLLEELLQTYPNQVQVLYTAPCIDEAKRFEQKGAEIALYHPKSLLLHGKIRWLKQAQVVLVDNYFPELALLDKQIVIQLWHAAGAIKKFGWEDPETSKRSKKDQLRFQKVYNQMDYIVVGSKKMAQIFQKSYQVPESVFCYYGCLRITQVKNAAYHVTKTKEKTESQNTSKNPYIVYAPTYRPDMTKMKAVLKKAYAAFEQMSTPIQVHLHPTVAMLDLNTPDNVVITDESLLDKYAQIDVLVTDYSACLMEYQAVNPAGVSIFFCPDYADYQKNPGIQEDFLTWLPGPMIRTSAELKQVLQPKAIVQIDKQWAIQRKRSQHLWNEYSDAQTVERVMKLVKENLG